MILAKIFPRRLCNRNHSPKANVITATKTKLNKPKLNGQKQLFMYKVPKGLNLPLIDKEILQFWKDHDVFKKSIEQRDPNNTFVFYEGPPSANGMPGIHHVMGRTVKDTFCRFQTLKGKRVSRKGGWDTHGLPVELKVEKELGITKEDIGKSISVDEYNRQCKETVLKFKDVWDDLTVKMGYWVDLEHPYITFKNEYIESVWNLLKKLYDKQLLYKGLTIQPYSPAAGTGLSTHELNQPGCYKDVSDTTIVAQFKVIKDNNSAPLFDGIDEGNLYFLAWTTTPWTLPSNTALAVHPKIDYLVVKTFNPYTKQPVHVILAKALLHKWFKPEQADLSFDDYQPEDKKTPYKIVAEYQGKDLEGIRYEQLMPYVQPDSIASLTGKNDELLGTVGDAFKVVVANFVTTEDGTGIVHIAPSFGADDMMVGKQNGLGSLTLVDKQGKFVDKVTDYAGRYVKDYKDDPNYQNVDIDIAIQLKKENKAFNVQKHMHNYPHCWRTDKPVLYYPLDSWFVKVTANKDRMIELNKTINWKPKSTGEGRFGNWLENIQDWNLSRSRYWGTPLPIWRTDEEVDKSLQEEICIGSLAQLQTEIDKANKALGLSQKMPKDLHRPYIDEVILVSQTGLPMKRESDLIDVWFDSGAMPYAQWHYPFENKDLFEGRFPADFIAEGVDQTRGWFYSLHAIATNVFDSVAYKAVVSNGLVLDKNGVKMSKRLGNTVDPFETLSTYGGDALRWYLTHNANPWDNLKFDENNIVEVQRKFFGTLYNTYSFFALYANIDKFRYQEAEIALAERPEIDQWILSLLNSLIKEVDASYSDYEATAAARKIQDFVTENLSNWFVRLSRRRFWKGSYSQDKISAYQTLYTCLNTVAKLMSPISPFFSDWLYQNLNEVTQKESPISIHLTDFPIADNSLINKELEQRMDYAQRISSLALSLRKKEKIRVRQPLNKLLIPVLDKDFERQVDAVKDLILAETNIKNLEYLYDSSGFIKKKIKPNFKTLGRRLGKNMKQAAAIINQLDQDAINNIEKTGQLELTIDNEKYLLTLEDFEISPEDIEGWTVATDGNLTVAMDITLDKELLAEGLARELINRVQNIRKDQGFDVQDRINIKISPDPKIENAVTRFGELIKQETLANSLTTTDNDGQEVELPNDLKAKIQVEKI